MKKYDIVKLKKGYELTEEELGTTRRVTIPYLLVLDIYENVNACVIRYPNGKCDTVGFEMLDSRTELHPDSPRYMQYATLLYSFKVQLRKIFQGTEPLDDTNKDWVRKLIIQVNPFVVGVLARCANSIFDYGVLTKLLGVTESSVAPKHNIKRVTSDPSLLDERVNKLEATVRYLEHQVDTLKRDVYAD